MDEDSNKRYLKQRDLNDVLICSAVPLGNHIF